MAAIFVSDLPEGLSSAAGMKWAGCGAGYVLDIWGGVAAMTAVAGGAILAMLTDTMVPEVVEGTRSGTGLVAGAGLTAFAIGHLGG